MPKTKFKGILYQKTLIEAKKNNYKSATRRDQGLDVINENPADWFIESMRVSGPGSMDTNIPDMVHFENRETKQRISIKNPYNCEYLWSRENTFKVNNLNFYVADNYKGMDNYKTIPSIHQPAKYARFWDRVIRVYPQRICYMYIGDIWKEGLRIYGSDTSLLQPTKFRDNYLDAWKKLWININGQESYDKGIWVWVIEYEQQTIPPEGWEEYLLTIKNKK